jgi:uncharacterized protein YbjQ (UPF0145 family)
VLLSTTNSIEGKRIAAYYGIVSGDAIIGANIFRDLFARVRDIIGGRAAGYERALQSAKQAALDDMVARRRRWAPTPSSPSTSTTRRSATAC